MRSIQEPAETGKMAPTRLLLLPAAYTDVDGCAKNPDLAYTTNTLGPKYVAQACAEIDIPLVYVSTNEVFDGTAAIGLVWLGRRRIAGIEPGRRIVATGRVGVHNGRLAIYNPWYELQSTP